MKIKLGQMLIDKIRKKKKKSSLISYDIKVVGIDNVLNIPKSAKIFGYIIGNNNTLDIEDSEFNSNIKIFVGLPECPVNNCVIHIGHNFSGSDVMIRICEDNTEVIIGNDCMFSSDVQIWASDTHTITDMNGNCTNIGRFVHIGNHVWLGYGVFVLKNTTIPDDSVVGCKAVVCGKFDFQNSIIAGNPAKVMKKNVNWNRLRPKQYIQDLGRNINNKIWLNYD